MKKIILKIIALTSLFSGILYSCATSNKEKITPVEEIKAVEVPAEAKDSEYQRSKGDVNVTEEEFNNDKKQILVIISKLEEIMVSMNYESWYTYLDNESIEYWSKPANLKRAAARLPVKGLKLNSLSDYFKFVFVPARAGRSIDEIRYETKDLVKVVQFQEETDTIYYNFNRIDGKWKLHLPYLDD